MLFNLLVEEVFRSHFAKIFQLRMTLFQNLSASLTGLQFGQNLIAPQQTQRRLYFAGDETLAYTSRGNVFRVEKWACNIDPIDPIGAHSTFQLTMDTYSHMIPTRRQEVADRMDSVFGATPTNAATSEVTEKSNDAARCDFMVPGGGRTPTIARRPASSSFAQAHWCGLKA